jgi:hypothetical protein
MQNNIIKKYKNLILLRNIKNRVIFSFFKAIYAIPSKRQSEISKIGLTTNEKAKGKRLMRF